MKQASFTVEVTERTTREAKNGGGERSKETKNKLPFVLSSSFSKRARVVPVAKQVVSGQVGALVRVPAVAVTWFGELEWRSFGGGKKTSVESERKRKKRKHTSLFSPSHPG